MICAPTKFEVATFNDLGGDAFAKERDGRTQARTDGRTTDESTKVILYDKTMKRPMAININTRCKPDQTN